MDKRGKFAVNVCYNPIVKQTLWMKGYFMKFQINVECSPEEAREFFGLPDVLPMQQDLMEMVSRRLSENIQTMEPEILMKTWVPALFQGWSDVQSHFWNQMHQSGAKMDQKANKHKMDFNFNPFAQPPQKDEDGENNKPKTSRPSAKKRK